MSAFLLLLEQEEEEMKGGKKRNNNNNNNNNNSNSNNNNNNDNDNVNDNDNDNQRKGLRDSFHVPGKRLLFACVQERRRMQGVVHPARETRKKIDKETKKRKRGDSICTRNRYYIYTQSHARAPAQMTHKCAFRCCHVLLSIRHFSSFAK